MIVSCGVYMVRYPRGSYLHTHCCHWKWPHHRTNHLIGCCHLCASPPVLSKMQLTLHATRPTHHGAFRSVQAMSAWSVKTRRAPHRNCRYARVYGHSTTAMHDTSTPPAHYSGTALSPESAETDIARTISSAVPLVQTS